ncbi:MAG: glycosyltransferase family 4 protein [Bacteroidales bacterium]|nr:glycosyltransferase family 4 protein [Bacteroidales bacterium]
MKNDHFKIAINCRHWLPGKMEGFGRYVSEIAPRLAVTMPEVKFYWLFDRKPSSSIPDFSNVQKIILPPPARTIELIRCWNDLSVRLFLKKKSISLFFSPDNHLSLTTQVPQVVTIHDINFMVFPHALPPLATRFYQKRTPSYLRKSTHILTVSEFSKKEILRFFPFVAEEKISVVYNGISSVFKPLTPKQQQETRNKYTSGQPYFFVLGSLHQRKNIQNTIEAFQMFKQKINSPWYLVITGRPLWKNVNLNIANDIRADIIFTGYVSDEEVARLMGAAHALVFCSLYEGFGLPLAEAFACHIPAITSSNSALAEIGSRGALLVNPNSPSDIAHAMVEIATNTSLYQKLIEETMMQKQFFNWDKTVERISQIFLKILNQTI